MARRTALCIAAVTAGLTLVTACSSSGDGSGNTAGSSGPGTSNGGSKQILIGDLASKSGQYSICQPADATLSVAIDEINAGGGVKLGDTSYTFKVESLDDESDPAKSAANARQLIQDGAKVIFGPCGSGAASVLQLTKASKIILVSPASSAVAAIKPGGPRQYLLTSLPSADDRAASAVAATKQFVPDAKSMLLIGSDDPTFAEVVSATESAWKAAGGTTSTVLYSPGTSDLSGFLARVRSANPDVLYIGQNTQSVTLVLEQLDAAGISKNLTIIGHGTDPALAAKTGGRPYIAVPFSPGPISGDGANSASQALADKYLQTSGQKVLPAYAPPLRYYYDIAKVLAQAIGTAGTAEDADKILDQVLGTSADELGYEGALGKISFTADGVIRFPLVSTYVDAAGKQSQNTWTPGS